MYSRRQQNLIGGLGGLARRQGLQGAGAVGLAGSRVRQRYSESPTMTMNTSHAPREKKHTTFVPSTGSASFKFHVAWVGQGPRRLILVERNDEEVL